MGLHQTKKLLHSKRESTVWENIFADDTSGKGLICKTCKELTQLPLAGVAQWIEHWPAIQKVAGLIPSKGTCLGCGPVPQ